MGNLPPLLFLKFAYALPWEWINHTCAKVLGTGFPQALAGRVIGKPAGGNDPKQLFSSCGGLQAFSN